MQPLVSIVVPVFNGMPYLEPLTNALLRQTYTNLEIIFTEGGGSDDSIDYLSSLHDPRVRVVQMPPGTSPAENWTAASMQARGEFTKLVCQDDLLYPHAIDVQLRDLRDVPAAVMAIARRDIMDARGKILFHGRGLGGLPKHERSVQGEHIMRACYLQGTNVLGEPLAVLFRTALLQEAMPWDDSDPLMLDMSIYQRIAPLGEVALRRESVGAFRVSDTSWSTRLASEQLDQTKRWQNRYRADQERTFTRAERARALIGRHVTTGLRRAAYTSLRAKGNLRSSGGKS